MEPRFLDLAEVIEIHLDQIERYGGATGTRDLALLQSAVAMPQAGVAQTYVHGDLFEMAAAYLFHITCNHCPSEEPRPPWPSSTCGDLEVGPGQAILGA